MFKKILIATALALIVFPGVASACGPGRAATYKLPKLKYDLIVDGSWHYLNDHDVEIDITRTLHGPRLQRLEIKDQALGKDEINILCGPGPWRFERTLFPEGGTYRGRFFLMKSPDDIGYKVHHWVPPGKEAAK